MLSLVMARVIDRKTKKITGKVFLQEKEKKFVQANINDIYFDGGKYLFLTSFYVERFEDKTLTDSHGDVYVIDVEKKSLFKIVKIPREYLYIDGVYNLGDKLYVSALAKGEFGPSGSAPPNKELLIYSLNKNQLIKKIDVTGNPFKLICDPSVNKLYVQHMNNRHGHKTVEIIDTTSDEVIGTLEIPYQLMFSVVKPGKMYITVGKGYRSDPPTEPALLVLDTKTDKIIKRIEGNYKGISVNTIGL